jgi:hypothetical protein
MLCRLHIFLCAFLTWPPIVELDRESLSARCCIADRLESTQLEVIERRDYVIVQIRSTCVEPQGLASRKSPRWG